MNRRVSSFKASPTTRDKPVPTLELIFDHEPPEPSPDNRRSERTWREMYEFASDRVEAALFETLPGGLYDQLLRAMLTRKASLLKVSHKE